MSKIEWLNFKLFAVESTGFDSRQPHQVAVDVDRSRRLFCIYLSWLNFYPNRNRMA